MLVQASLQPLEVLLKIIVQQYLNESYCLTVISEHMLNANMITKSMTYINSDCNTEKLFDRILAVSEMGCSDYIVQMSKPEMFMSAYEKVNRQGDARRGNKKIIFLPSYEENASNTLLNNILSHGETAFISDLLLIIPGNSTAKCESYDLVSHKYIGIDEEANDPVYLDHWNSCTQKFSKNTNLMPNRIKNLYGKSLKVACFSYEPYVLLDLDKSEVPLGHDGTEMRIMDEFCRWVNCTVKIIRDDTYEWGDIFENGTGNGVLGNVVEDRADLGITALYSWFDMYKRLDFSAPCVRSGITCLTPAPRILASWELPLLAFSWVMWITLFLTFVYASVALYIAKGFSSDKVLITTFGMMITQSQKDAGSNWRVRSITGWLLITGLVLDNAYGGGLAATFTVPKYEKSIDTVQDIVDSRMPWGATHDAWKFSLVLSKDPKIMQLVNQFQTHEADVLKKKSFTRSMAFSVEKLPAGYFAIGNYITKEAVRDMELMLEDFYYEYTVVMARKSSPFIEKVTELVGRLHETGLMQAWEKQVALKYLNYQMQLEVKLSRLRREADIDALGLHHVVGIFIVYIVGLTVSVGILFTEFFISRRNL